MEFVAPCVENLSSRRSIPRQPPVRFVRAWRGSENFCFFLIEKVFFSRIQMLTYPVSDLLVFPLTALAARNWV